MRNNLSLKIWKIPLQQVYKQMVFMHMAGKTSFLYILTFCYLFLYACPGGHIINNDTTGGAHSKLPDTGNAVRGIYLS